VTKDEDKGIGATQKGTVLRRMDSAGAGFNGSQVHYNAPGGFSYVEIGRGKDGNSEIDLGESFASEYWEVWLND